MNIKQLAKDPLAQLGAGLSGIVALLNPEVFFALFDALLASGPQIFSVVSVSALTLPQVLPPTSTADWVVVGAAVLFIGYLTQQVLANLDRAT
ncbi:hypothetical protein PM076_03495 [Halorubrum ezzemoulense]|uniref:Uncharacterized protein n=1 Tax=Halorubrum ezzemoulense TaxID=337243 RepID=A0A256IY66_HALEZ|nr:MULTISPECIES: hypothetical protein [Halorubrum]MDB2244506.1 hypothetical protein [Halorubrum ezzemoulense]MDB2278737.1 hypothetical protein [Halorubrum ezzemoulense]MDB2285799.1 hypothetical protein [Halorubrum ezzemoulense]MDB2287840.1 hypothetical protein [Halorubrum ezzemoulense]MDB2291965.1 hypothetical protein [Halorubrum ezzemoulense]